VDYIGFGLLGNWRRRFADLLDKGQEDDWFGSNFIVGLRRSHSLPGNAVDLRMGRHDERSWM